MDFTSFDPIIFFNNLPSASNPFSAMFYIFINGGWIAFVFVSIWGFGAMWLEWRRNKFDASVKYVLLAIDVPKDNEQSPKAVEHIFSHLYGVDKKPTLKEKWIDGETQLGFSLEIVSIEGYIQFIIRSPKTFRDLVEAAVYAQYPDAEITEVEDYIDMVPHPLELPEAPTDIWGSEFKLARDEVYPIRTYPFFEHSLSQKLMDPMASLLEIMSRMGPGEQLWLQLLIEPTRGQWREKGIKILNNLIGKKNEKKGGDLGYFPREISKGLFESFTASLIPPSEMEDARNMKQEREWPSMMQHLSPDEKEIVESIAMKISKLGFKSKMRFIYSAPKGKVDKGKGVNAIAGAIHQFSTQNLNGLIINSKTKTKVDYFFVKTRTLARKRRLLWGYRYRSMKRGRPSYVLNIEELASVWHFPMIDVKVPTVQSVGAKKGQPPTGLPLETLIKNNIRQTPTPPTDTGISTTDDKKTSPPENLPM